MPENITRRIVVQQRIEKMFERNVFVPPLDGFGHGGI